MTDLFLKVLSMSLSALWLVGVVLLLRVALKRSPKWIHVLLWAMVAIRLVCPFSFESSLSLIPESVSSGEVLEEWSDDYVGEVEIIHDIRPEYQTAVDAGREPVSAGKDGYYVVTGPDGISEPDTVKTAQLPILAGIWLTGMAVIALYTVVSYLSLRRKMSTAVRMKGNIYRSEAAASPFVLGLIRPRIYLPFAMDEMDIPHVIAHEKAHIRRKDHWWKPIGFLVLTLHWFNPVVWLSYILLCRDIELACDEKVIKEMNLQQQADYSQALLNCSVHRRSIAACPLAFGEVGVKKRVSNILNYRKPAFWIVLTGLILCIVVAVCFLTNPPGAYAPFGMEWYLDRYLYTNSELSPDRFVYVTTDESGGFNGSADPRMVPYDILLLNRIRLSRNGEAEIIKAANVEQWEPLGTFREAHLSMLNFDEYFKNDNVWLTTLYRPEKFRETCTRAWRLDVNPDGPGLFYLLLELEDGRFYLMCGYDENTSHAAQEEQSTMYWVVRLSEEAPFNTAIQWFDYLETNSHPSADDDNQAKIPHFPGVTFQADPDAVYAETEEGSTEIITGMPVWNVYFCDLTGDSIYELCATVSYGSGIIDEHVVVYDYATGTEYTLWDRGVFDYTLRLEDGKLVCDRWFYPHNDLSASGQLMLVSAGGGDGMRLEIDTGDTKEEPTSVSFEDFDFSDVTDIRLDNAHNGKSTAISDPDAVKSICTWLSNISGSNGRNSKGWHYQGTFALTLMAEDETVFQISFGDDDVFFYGKYDKNYAMMYDLDRDIDDVIRFLYRYDESGFDWGYEETVAVAETTPYDITSTIPEDGLKGDIEYLQPGDIIGYGFLKVELQELGTLLNNLTEDAFEAPADYTPTMKINLRWDGGRMTLYSDGKQTVFGEDGEWAVRTEELNRFLSQFNQLQETHDKPDHAALEDLPKYYNSEQAMIDGCVVMRDGDILSGQDLFAAFYGEVSAGAPASIRIASFYEEPSVTQVADISFDGEGFTWRAIENGKISEKHYQYLYHYSEKPESSTATFDAIDCYVLTNEKGVTWKQLWNGLLSSAAGAYIDHVTIYNDYIYYPNHPTIPDCESITLEYEGELLLKADNVDALEALFSRAEETYEPKTWSPGPVLCFHGKDGTEVIITLSLDNDWCCIDGIYYDYGPGYDADGSYDASEELYDLLGIERLGLRD